MCIICISFQDRVPAFSPKKARGFVEKELGAPIHVLFKEFEDQPIAAASLGQVFVLLFYIYINFLFKNKILTLIFPIGLGKYKLKLI